MILAKSGGKAIRFHESDVRAMGRTAHGVNGTTLDGEEGDVVGMVVVKRAATLLVVTENGYGKRTEIDEYRVTDRGGKGIITIKTTDRNGPLVAIKEVVDADELMIITKNGKVIRMPIANVSMIGRNTQGVRLIRLDEGDAVVGVAHVVKEEGEGEVVGGGEDVGTTENGGEPGA